MEGAAVLNRLLDEYCHLAPKEVEYMKQKAVRDAIAAACSLHVQLDSSSTSS